MKLSSFLSRTFGSTADATMPVAETVTRVAICGEVSAGKSTVLNALLRAPMLSDNLGATSRPTVILRHGPRNWAVVRFADGNALEMPTLPAPAELRDAVQIELWSTLPHLKGYEFVEVPLTAADELTAEQEALVASCQIMVWVTIASQAWRLTEQTLLDRLGEAVPDRRILAVSRADKLASAADRGRVQARVVRETHGIFEAFVFVDGGRAILAKAGDDDAWVQTSAPELLDTLNEIREELGTVAEEAEEEDDDGDEVVMVYRGRVYRKRDMAGDGNAKPKKAKALPKPEAPPMPVEPRRVYRGSVMNEADAAAVGPEPEDTRPPMPKRPAPTVERRARPRPEPMPEAASEVAITPPPPAPKPAPKADPLEIVLAASWDTPEPDSIGARLAPLPSGVIVAGVLPQSGGDPTVVAGNGENCRRLAKVCKAAMDQVRTAHGHTPDDASDSLSLSTPMNRLYIEDLGAAGMVFVLFDARTATLGTAQATMGRIKGTLLAD